LKIGLQQQLQPTVMQRGGETERKIDAVSISRRIWSTRGMHAMSALETVVDDQ
jgi:hypothetical protein